MRRTWAVLVLAMTAGCGAKFEAAGGDGGTSDGGGSGDGGSSDGGGWSPVCPASLPGVGTACTPDGATCEYGTSVYTSCNAIVTCSQGSWRSTTYPSVACPSGPNPAACPASFTSVPRGAVCAPSGTECAYAEGACRCETPFFGPPQPLDGGHVEPSWHCDDPTPGCPAHRPRIGSSCTFAPNMSCTYRECAFSEQCIDGYWQGQPEACANSGGGTP